MTRHDMIEHIGKEYLTSNIEALAAEMNTAMFKKQALKKHLKRH